MKNRADPPPLQHLKRLDEALRVDFSSRYLLVEGIERCPIPMFVINHKHVISVWNRALAQLTGLSGEQMVGTRNQWQAFYSFERPTLADLMVDGTVEQEIDRYYGGKYHRSPMLDRGFEVSDFFPDMGEDGRWLFFTAVSLKDTSGYTAGAIQTLQDVTTQSRAELALKESQSFLNQIVNGSSVPTFVIDREHRVTHWNRACESITGVQADELIGTRDHWRAFYDKKRPLIADLILSHALETDVDHLYDGRFRRSTLIDGAFEADRYFPHFGEDGKWLFFTAAPLRDANGKFIGAIETLQDITEQKRAEQALRNSEENFRLMSITDSLTGLFNVRHFYEQIEIEVKRAVRYGRPLSMLLLDLDHFKNLNDVHGHLEGDRALAVAANVIRNNFREHDTAYRYGGEEFTVLLPETDIEAATMLAERLIKTLANTPLTTDFGNVLTMTASVGVAEYVADDTATSLVRRADTGVYEAKRLGRNRVSVMR